MTKILFVSDLHGKIHWYEKLVRVIRDEEPDALLMGGDLLPHVLKPSPEYPDFIRDFLQPNFKLLKATLKERYPRVMLILGNDDPRALETELMEVGSEGLWEYIHFQTRRLDQYSITGYACVPPTPFQLKDWERYDVSRYVDPGCISPEEGKHSTEVDPDSLRYTTIQKDLVQLFQGADMQEQICLFHSPPYRSNLDRAALDGQMVDHAPLDVNVGSIAIQRMIRDRQPKITLHGHIHESSRLTGDWRDRSGRTYLFSAAYEGPELAVVKFDPEYPEAAERLLV